MSYLCEGERLIGLPDSLDIVNLWMGYPSPDPESESYAPVAYEDMKYMQEKLGTRFVLHGDAATTRDVVYKGDTLDIQNLYNQWKDGTGTEEAFRQALHNHAQIMIDKVNEAGLDGVDVDWEPQPAVWRDHETIVYLMKYLRENLPGKLIILDIFSDVPPAEVNEYIDYLVIQCYTPQIGCSTRQLRNFYTTRGINAGIPAEKIIICEQGGQTDYALNGGGAWMDDNGNPIMTSDGSQMYSFEGFARWSSEHDMAGWGVFYVDRNYYSAKGPYYEFRKGIQVANPSIR